MSKNELKELFKDNTFDKKYKISASSLLNIRYFANVSLMLDKKTLDYFYEVDIDELLESEMPDDEYEVLKDQGWSIDRDKLKIFLTI